VTLRFPPPKVIALLASLLFLAAAAPARAGFLDDTAKLGAAVAALHGALGDHPRVLRIAIDAEAVVVDVPDPRNRSQVGRWRYGTVKLTGVVGVMRLSGPQPVDPQPVNPDLEANLFDLDAVDLTAAPKLAAAAVARVKLNGPAAVTRIEIARQVLILPKKPTIGDVGWTLRVDGGREFAEVYADAQGVITGMNVGATTQ
jgi:hypothetical protein